MELLMQYYSIFKRFCRLGNSFIAIKMVSNLKDKHDIGHVVLVADRAMFSDDNLQLMESGHINYIVAARLKNLSKNIKKNIAEDDDYKACVIENEFHWIREYAYKGRRLIVSYSSKRAQKDAADRKRLIERLMKKTKDGKIKIKDLIPNYGTKKYIKTDKNKAELNEAKIEDDAKWDGLHGVITNMEKGSGEKILSLYRGLWQIEEAFRISKHDLKMRPIYHWTEERIKAHIAICFLAFTLAKQAVYRVSKQQMPMSFEQIRNELLHVQSSLVVDIGTKKRYIIPSHVTLNQKKIYQTFGLKRSEVPCSV
jgi:transposase